MSQIQLNILTYFDCTVQKTTKPKANQSKPVLRFDSCSQSPQYTAKRHLQALCLSSG